MLSAARTFALGSLNRLKDVLKPVPALSDLQQLSPRRLRSIIASSGLFDANYYLAQRAGAAEAPADPLTHYIDVGEASGGRPNEFFDPAWYAARHSDIGARQVNQLAHYILIGGKEGRVPGPEFDPAFYLREYADVAAVRIDPLIHYLDIGRMEGRAATAGQTVLAPGAWFNVVETRDLGLFQTQRETIMRVFETIAGTAATLHLLHRGGGGAERHVAELAGGISENGRQVVLFTQRQGAGLRAVLLLQEGDAWRRFKLELVNLQELAAVLARLGVNRVHVHQAREVLPDLNGLIDALGASVDITVHDYSLLCPRNSFVNVGGQYCGEPDVHGCRACLMRKPDAGERDIVRWRAAGISLLRRAERVVCPTEDTAQRIRRYVCEARIEVVPHSFAASKSEYRISPEAVADRTRVAVLGTLSDHKGGHFLVDCIEAARASGAAIDWAVVGSFGGSVTKRAHRLRRHMQVTGAYDSRRLPTLLAGLRPDLLFFPQHCVETYSYALSEALLSGLPILAPRLGAFPERLTDVANARLYDPQRSPADLVADIAAWKSSAPAPL